MPLDAMREGARGLREATQSAAQGAGACCLLTLPLRLASPKHVLPLMQV